MPLTHRDSGAIISRVGLNAALPILWNISLQFSHIVVMHSIMVQSFTTSQLRSLETIERIASCFSLIGTTFVMATFMYSSAFRKPINRLVFYASIGTIEVLAEKL